MKVPSPMLTYHLWLSARHGEEALDPTHLIGDGPPLFNVHEVTASRYRSGEVTVYVTGAMRKRDGTQGRHNRGLRLDLSQPQPDWVMDIVQDARTRL